MKATNFTSLLTITLGFAADNKYPTWAHARAEKVAPVETEPSARVNVKSLARNLEFIGGKPDLEGRPLLIVFWATWWPPCRVSIAHLNELHKNCHENGLQILGITSEDKTVIERFRALTPIHYAVALDRDQVLAAKFQVDTLPQAWLLDKEGLVVWSGHSMKLDEQTIARLLGTYPIT